MWSNKPPSHFFFLLALFRLYSLSNCHHRDHSHHTSPFSLPSSPTRYSSSDMPEAPPQQSQGKRLNLRVENTDGQTGAGKKKKCRINRRGYVSRGNASITPSSTAAAGIIFATKQATPANLPLGISLRPPAAMVGTPGQRSGTTTSDTMNTPPPLRSFRFEVIHPPPRSRGAVLSTALPPAPYLVR